MSQIEDQQAEQPCEDVPRRNPSSATDESATPCLEWFEDERPDSFGIDVGQPSVRLHLGELHARDLAEALVGRHRQIFADMSIRPLGHNVPHVGHFRPKQVLKPAIAIEARPVLSNLSDPRPNRLARRIDFYPPRPRWNAARNTTIARPFGNSFTGLQPFEKVKRSQSENEDRGRRNR